MLSRLIPPAGRLGPPGLLDRRVITRGPLTFLQRFYRCHVRPVRFAARLPGMASGLASPSGPQAASRADVTQSATPTIDLAATPGDSGGYEEDGEEKDTMTRAGHALITVAPACHQPR